MKKQTLLIVLVAVQVGLCCFSYVVGKRDRLRIATRLQRMTAEDDHTAYRDYLALASEDRSTVMLFLCSCFVAICVNGTAILIVCFRLKSQPNHPPPPPPTR
jgi:hypothetical protein